MILGITGGTGCGKTTLLRELRARGGEVLDCDEIYHALLQTDAALLAALEEQMNTWAAGTGGLLLGYDRDPVPRRVPGRMLCTPGAGEDRLCRPGGAE